jgi:hypothetical protein
MLKRTADNEVVVDLIVACVLARFFDATAHQFQPASGRELLGGAVEVAANAPRTRDELEDAGNRLKQAQVWLGGNANGVVEIDAAKVNAAAANCPNVSEYKSALTIVFY